MTHGRRQFLQLAVSTVSLPFLNRTVFAQPRGCEELNGFHRSLQEGWLTLVQTVQRCERCALKEHLPAIGEAFFAAEGR